MSDTAAEQLRRVLHLIPQLADGKPHRIDDVAARLGIDRNALLADIRSLTYRFDDPGGFVEGVSVTWDDEYVNAVTGQFHRPMRLTMRELCALELGLSLLRSSRAAEEWPPIDRALERLRTAITKLPTNDRLEHTFAAAMDAGGDDLLPVIRAAMGHHRKLILEYRGGSARESSTRTVCPYGLVFASGMWYLVGFCEQSDGLRFFRLDRTEHAAETNEAFQVPDDFSLDRVVEAHRALQPSGADTMTVRYSPQVAPWIAEREGKTLDADGSLTMEHPLLDTGWAVRHVLQYGTEAEVLRPESMRREVRRALDVMAAGMD